MPRSLIIPRHRPLAKLLLLSLTTVGLSALSAEAQERQRPPSAAVQPGDRRAGVIMDGAEAPAGEAEIVDESALRFYASQRQTERVQAEIARLRRRYPNWTAPTDLDTIEPSPPEEAPMWDLFTAGRFEDLRAAIAARQAIDREWRPSADLARKLSRGTLRSEVKSAAADGDWGTIVARIDSTPDVLPMLDVDIAWLVAEAFVRTGRTARAAQLYRDTIQGQKETQLRVATAQKALSLLPMPLVEPILALAQPSVDGKTEFEPLRLDVTRARIASILRDEKVGPVDRTDLASLGAYVARLNDPDQLSLLGWYAYKRRQFREALEWFKTAMSRGGSATVATGLTLSLRDVGQDREAEEVAFAWRGASVTGLALYVDLMERRLTQPETAPIEVARLDRFAKVVLFMNSGGGAQALGWYAYNACQFDAALDWFQRAVAWHPRGAAVLGYALSLGRLKRTREYVETLNRYDGLFPRVVELAMIRDAQSQAPDICVPGRGAAGRAPPPPPPPPPAAQLRVPKPGAPIPAPTQSVVKRAEFPLPVAPENPLRFGDEAAAPSPRDGEYLREEPAPRPGLIARRVPGVPEMPYELFGYTLLPAWNGLDRATLNGPPSPPAGTLAHAELANAVPSAGLRPSTAQDGNRFGAFDSAANSGSRPDGQNGARDR